MIKQATFVIVAAICISPLVCAQQIDFEAMTKWATATIVHYHVEGVHQGWTAVSEDQASQGDVTDRLTIDFNYNLQENKIVGQAKFENIKTSTKGLRNLQPPCPAPILKGDYEHFDARQVNIADLTGEVVVNGMRSFPAAEVGSQCPLSNALKPVPAKEVPVKESFTIPHPMILFTGGATSSDTTISADKKSMSLKVGGWVWTFTPTIVQ